MPDTGLYERDFVAWADEQAQALRRAAASGSNLDLDWEHLIEEVEDLGISMRRAAESELLRIIEHLLKLEWSPARDPRNGWKDSVTNHRVALASLTRASATLARHLSKPKVLADAYGDACRLVIGSLSRHDGVTPDLPPACPYSLDQIRDDWWPVNRHSVE